MEYSVFLTNPHRNICRICLQEVTNFIDLFSHREKSKEILNKIFLCFQIILNFEKYLPCVICNSCTEEINVANSFRLKCITFNERFNIYCKQLTEKRTFSPQRQVNETIKKEPNNEDSNLELFEVISDTDFSTYESNKIDSINEGFSSDVTNHVVLKKNIDVNYKCDICNKVLKTRASLLKHKISMHQKRKHVGNVTGFGSARRYHCTKCTYSTPHSQTLVNHMRRHDGERPYHCECGKSFTQSSSLTAHRKTHSSITYFTCPVCGKQFKHAFTLKNHLRVHESGNFSCSICEKVLKSKQSLQNHMHRHYNIRNYNCEDCGDTFVTCSELLNHRKKHSLEKKIECHLCGYKTHTKKNLIVHLKRHTGDKTFKCDLCEVTFYTKGDLRRHQRVHTREKPFSCPTCAQRFTHSPSLNKHMQTVHGIEYKWVDFKAKKIKLFTKN